MDSQETVLNRNGHKVRLREQRSFDDKSRAKMKYVLITPRRNEQAFIGKTLESDRCPDAVAGTLGDCGRWLDGSHGGNRRTHAKNHPWINLSAVHTMRAAVLP